MPHRHTRTAGLTPADIVAIIDERTTRAVREHDMDALHALVGVLCAIDSASAARAGLPPRPERGIVRRALDTRPTTVRESTLIHAHHAGEPESELPESAFVPDPPDNVRRRVELVQRELDRLNASDQTPPFGGWYSQAVTFAAALTSQNPFALDRAVRPYIAS